MAHLTAHSLAMDVFTLNIVGLEDYEAAELINALQEADTLYHNEEGSPLTDGQYDSVRSFAQILAPHHSYFTGVGSEVRGGKIKLPYEMGSLDQVQIGDITDWVGTWQLQKELTIVTDKLDGTSAMVLYDENGDLQIAYSRGNGTEGADITRHIKRIVPLCVAATSAVIRGEVILTKPGFKALRTKIKSSSGKIYKNARNMVAGIMNSSSRPDVVYEYLQFVAYDIINSGIHKEAMLTTLMDLGFNVPYWANMDGRNLTDKELARHLTSRRDLSPYEIDGLVIDVDCPRKRSEMNPTKETLNPAYMVKYKVADDSNQAIARVKQVHWAASKHGYLKPRVEIEPIELVGVTITFASGFNAKFIYDNNIGPGAKVRITRSGDVIPFIQEVVEQAIPQMPASTPEDMDLIWEWNETGVDAVVVDKDAHEEIVINSMTDFFASIEAPYLKKGNVEKLFKAGYGSVEAVIVISQKRLVGILGENGMKVYVGLHERLHNIQLYKILGAYSSERGLGVRKMKKLQKALGRDALYTGHKTELCHDDITAVEGFEQKTAEKAITALNNFVDFMVSVGEYITLADDEDVSGGSMTDQKVVFTGFRDKPLQAEVEAQGGTMQSGVSGKTTILVAKNPNSTSSKMKKARDNGTLIVGIEEFKDML